MICSWTKMTVQDEIFKIRGKRSTYNLVKKLVPAPALVYILLSFPPQEHIGELYVFSFF